MYDQMTNRPAANEQHNQTFRRAGTTPRHHQLPKANDCSFEQLVLALNDGDNEAWNDLFQRLTTQVERRLSAVSADRHIKNDAIGFAWEQLLTHLPTIREPEAIPAWFARVARNKLLAELALRKRVELRDVNVSADNSPFESSPFRTRPRGIHPEDTWVEDRAPSDPAARALLDRVVDQLPERQREVVRCRLLTDDPEPLNAMVERLGIPRGSIGPTLGRAVKKLRSDPEIHRWFGDGLDDAA